MQKHLKRLDTIIKYGVAAILLAIPLYPKFPAIRIPQTYVAIRLEDFLIGALVFVWLLRTIPSINKTFLKDKINRAFVIFLLTGFVSLISAIFLTKTVVAHLGFLHWVRRVEYIALFFVGVTAIKKEGDIDFYLKTLAITIIVAFLYGLGQKYLTWPVIITQNLEYSKGIALRWIPGSHLNSTFAGHYDLATFLVLLLPIYVTSFFAVKGTRSKTFLLVTIFSGLWLLINAISRISIASYLLGATVALFILKKYKAIPLVILVSIIFFSLSSDLTSRYIRIIDITQKRLKELVPLNNLPANFVSNAYAQDSETLPQRRVKKATPTPVPLPVFEDRSTSIRFNVEWPRALRAFAKNPLLGTGYSSITLATDNDYLRLLGEVGIIGFFAFFLIFARLAKVFIKAIIIVRRQKIDLSNAYLAGIIGALSGIFLNAVFIDVFEASKFATIFWLLIGLTVSLVRANDYG